jgi:hypothetical protein
VSFIVHDMEQNQHLRESSELAADRATFAREDASGSKPWREASGLPCPRDRVHAAVLVEIGFGTNEAEARYLRDPARQREIATSIADATMQYLAAYQRRTSARAVSRSERATLETVDSASSSAAFDFRTDLLAAGTRRTAKELDDVVQLDRLGGIITKAVSLEPRHGAPSPRCGVRWRYDECGRSRETGCGTGAGATPAVAREAVA